MSAVWVVRDPRGYLHASGTTLEDVFHWSLRSDQPYTVTRETLLTPEQAAVLEAAKAFCDKPRLSTEDALKDAVTTLRAQEGM